MAATYLAGTGIVAALGSVGAAGAGAVSGAAMGAGIAGASKLGAAVGHKISDSIESDVWIERTET